MTIMAVSEEEIRAHLEGRLDAWERRRARLAENWGAKQVAIQTAHEAEDRARKELEDADMTIAQIKAALGALTVDPDTMLDPS